MHEEMALVPIYELLTTKMEAEYRCALKFYGSIVNI